MTKLPSISVVVPAYNEEKLIARCLDALLNLEYPVEQIFVVDNNSTDKTVEIARQYHNVTVLREKNQGITYGRNRGFDAVTSDIIARIDADSIAHPSWSRVIAEYFRDKPISGLGGNAAVAEFSPGNRFWLRWYYKLFRAWHQNSLQTGPVLYGFNSAIRTSAWKDIRSKLSLGDNNISEDVDVSLALITSGHSVVYTPKMLVKCHVFRSIDRKKLQRYYRTDNATLTKYKIGNQKRWIN